VASSIAQVQQAGSSQPYGSEHVLAREIKSLGQA